MSTSIQTSEILLDPNEAAIGRSFFIPPDIENKSLVELSEIVEVLGDQIERPGSDPEPGEGLLPHHGLDVTHNQADGSQVRIATGPAKEGAGLWTWSVIFNRPGEVREALIADVDLIGRSAVWQHVKFDQQGAIRRQAKVNDESEALARFVGRALNSSDVATAAVELASKRAAAYAEFQENPVTYFTSQTIGWRAIGFISLGRLNSGLLGPLPSEPREIDTTELPFFMRGFIESDTKPVFVSRQNTLHEK